MVVETSIEGARGNAGGPPGAAPSAGEVQTPKAALSGGWRLYRAIVLVSGILLVLLWAAVASVASTDRQETIRAAIKENENLARAFDEHIVSILNGLDQLVQLIRIQHAEHKKALDLARLFKTLQVPPAIVQSAILDERGYVSNSSLPFTRINLSDREHFRVHIEGHDSGKPFLSKPVLGRVSGKWSLQLTRRINNPDGSFGGVVVLSLDPYYFADFYQQVDLGSGGVVALVGLDGIVRARQSAGVFTLGQSIQDGPLFRELARGTSGSYLAHSEIDGTRRYNSYRMMRDYPFAVLVGTAEDEVLTPYRDRLRLLLGAAVGVTLLILAAASWLVIVARREARHVVEVEDSQARLEAFMDSVPDIGWFKDSAGRFVAVNRAFAERFGVDGQNIVGRTDAQVFGEEIAEKFRLEDVEVMSAGRLLRVISPAEQDGETRWFETIKVPVYDANGALRGTCGVARDITERKRADEALVESERRLALALDAADLALFDWDVKTGEVFISERWSAFLGGPPQTTQTTLKTLAECVHPDDREMLRSAVLRSLKQEVGTYRAQHRVRNNAGQWIWIEGQGSVVTRDEQGRALRMLGIYVDITDRKQIDNALRDSEQRFRNLTELSSDWYWEQDEQFRFTLFSGGFLDGTGALPDDYLGLTRWEVPSERVTEAQWVEHRATLERHEPFYDLVIQRTAASGETRYCSISGRPMFDAQGRCTGYQGIGQDITRRRKAETALREAHAFLDSIVENIPDVVMVKDARDLRLVRVNAAAERFFGYTRQELLGGTDRDFFPPDQAERFARDDQATLASGQLLDISEQHVATRVYGQRYVSMRKMPIGEEGGKPRFLLSILHDITERKLSEAAARDMNRMLEQRAAALTRANRDLESFSYTVSHDLRAPLRHINGFMNLLRERINGNFDPESERLFGKVTGAAQRMSELIDDLLAFSRMGRVPLQDNVVALNALIGELVVEVAPDPKERRIEWRIGPLPAVRGDKALLRLVFLNLLNNAVKYSSTRDRAVVEVFTAPGGQGEAVISVRDNGVGFDMKHAHRLFGVFQRLQSEFEGTGIGLATVKRIVERHGGRVWAEAESGKGAMFSVGLQIPEQAEEAGV